MSQYNFKFWPCQDVSETKIELLKTSLLVKGVLGEETVFNGNPAYSPGEHIDQYIVGFSNALKHRNMSFQIQELGCACLYGNPGEELAGQTFSEEGIIDLERKNMIEIFNTEDLFGSCDGLCALLEEITGDKYQGGFDMLT